MKKKIVLSLIFAILFTIILLSQNVLAIQMKTPKEGFLIENEEKEGFKFDEVNDYFNLNEELKTNNLEIIDLEENVNQNIDKKVLAADSNDEIIYNDLSGNIIKLYGTSDNKNDYLIKNTLFTSGNSYFEIIKHDIKNNTNTTIYKSKEAVFANKSYIRDNLIYIEQVNYNTYEEGKCNVAQILAFDIKTNKVIFESNNLNIKVDNTDYFHSFVVDSKQRIYIQYEYTGVKVFDKTGKLLYDRTPIVDENDETKYEIVLHSISPNDDGIIFSQGYYNNPSYPYLTTAHQGYQKLNKDGTFYNSNYTLYGRSPYTNYVKDPDWKFIDNTHAVNQYGEIAKFEYFTPVEGKYTGCTIQIIDTVSRNIYDSYYGYLKSPVYIVKNNYLYLFGSNNIIYVFDIKNNYSRVGKINTNIPVNSYSSSDDGIYRLTCIDDTIYLYYNDRSTGKRKDKKININSIEQFKNIWITEHLSQNHTKAQIIAKYKETLPKFNYSQNMYDVNPSYKAPYAAGKLKTAVVTDTLNQINYYRWLYGINEITINQDKMDRSQKGAVIQATTNTLTHTPSRPADMDEAFYKEAYAGCNAKYEKGDIYSGNCSQGDSSPANAVGGFISDIYNVTQGSYVGHRLSLLSLDSDRTSFGYCNRFTALSMYTREDGVMPNNEKFYSYPSAGNFPMQNFYTNEYWSVKMMQNYIIKDMKVELTYNNKTYSTTFAVEGGSVVFKMPNELVQALGKTGTMPKCKINVKLTGLKDDSGDTTNFNYDVNFFDINEVIIPLQGISFSNKEQIAYEGKEAKAQTLKLNPASTNDDYKIEWSSSDTKVATIDKNGNIICKKIGTTVITAKVGKFTATYTLNVKEAPPYILGDVNQDGKINSLDATAILKHVSKKKILTGNSLLAADVTKDGKVNSLDAVRILKYVAKKITEF